MADIKTEKKGNKKLLNAIIVIALIAVVTLLILLVVQENGLVRRNGKIYYYKNGERQYGGQVINGNNYYFQEDGNMYKGWLVWGDDLFYYRQGKGGKDVGGELMVGRGASFTDLNGVYWWVEFDENGKIESITYDYGKYKADGLEAPVDAVPKFVAND